MKSTLASLPAELGTTYDQVLIRIRNQEPEHAALALRILGWIHHAHRPLKIRELQHALAVESGDSHLDEDGIPDIGLILTVCAGIVTIREDYAVGLVHYTTAEYLERRLAEHFPDAPIDIAKTCLTYLMFDDFASPLQFNDGAYLLLLSSLWDRFKKYPFLGYASKYWSVHARDISVVDIQGLALQFLKQGGKILSCMQAMRPGHRNLAIISALAFAAELGLYEISKALLEAGADVDGEDSEDMRPLHIAAVRGSEDVVLLLLEHHADTETKDSLGATALHFAAQSGHHKVVKVLLEKRADVRATDRFGFSALHSAMFQGYVDVIKLLLKHGSDIEARDQWETTPLHIAAKHEYLDAIRLLLRSGADVEARDEKVLTVLYHTAFQARTGNGISFRFLAAACNHRATLKLMLDTGLDVETRDEHGDTALHWTAAFGRLESVQLLIDRGAQTNVRNLQDQTPLHKAAGYKRFLVAESLLQCGANPTIQDCDGRTPLDIAQEKTFSYSRGERYVTIAELIQKHPSFQNQKGDSLQSA